MRDLNFFEPYLEKHSAKFNKNIIIYSAILFLILAMSAYAVYNQLTIKALQKDISDRIVVAENPRTIEKVNEIKELEEELNIFREEVTKIVELDQTIDSSDIIGDDLLKFIKAKMPNDLFITSLSASDRDIQMSGITKDRYTVAEFAKGLEEIEDLDNIFISNITQEELYYKFVLNLTLKEVITDGQDSEQ